MYSSFIIWTGKSDASLHLYDSVFVSQLVAQVLDEFDDEDIGVGLIDAKHDKAVAKKLGKYNCRPLEYNSLCKNQTSVTISATWQIIWNG